MATNLMSVSGWIFNIQRFSLHDGPGIRTTIFLKGCPLSCVWCHNPEGEDCHPQTRLTLSLCAHCMRCVTACEQGCHVVTAADHAINPDNCSRCGRCVGACDFGAIEMVGSQMSDEDIMAVARRDAPFYNQSGGGITLSGGEPLMQFAFSQSILQMAKSESINTAIETSAFCSWDRLAALKPVVDLFLVDLKHTNDNRHRKLTGASNVQILENIQRMARETWPMRLRIPWIPGQNISAEFLDALEELLSALPLAPPVELMLYHRFGSDKRAAIGMAPSMPDDIPAATREDASGWVARLSAAGISVTTS